MTLTLLTKLDRHDNRMPPPLATEELRRVASQLGLDVSELQQSMKGGFGSVFIAEDHGLSRRVAIKILYKDWKPERMRREIVALRTFCSNESLHSHLIAIYSCFETEHYFCYTMECADNCALLGEEYKPDSLSNRIAQRDKPPSVDEIADFFHQLLDAVEFLHSQKLVHLDIKPDNILFVKGKLKLADYSLISSMEDVIEKSCGTSGFIPPNQRHGANGGLDGVDQDLYALGVVLHCFAENNLTWDGVSPFPKELQSQPFYKKLNRFLLKACNACETERFHNVSELRKAFDACFPQKKYWGVKLAACVPVVLFLVVLAVQMMVVMSRRFVDKTVQDKLQSSNIEEVLEQKMNNDFVFKFLDKYKSIPQESDAIARTLFYGYPDAIVEKLVDKKANVNAVFTVPHDIQTWKDGIKIQFQAEQKVTALGLAVMQDRPKIVELLLKNGADINWKDENGKTVKDLACSKEIRKILRSSSVKAMNVIPSEKLATAVNRPEEYLYVVVDLSGGPDVTSYPVHYTNTAPDLNNDLCRTTELWLRKIEPGTFTMGSSADEVGRYLSDMTQHKVKLTQPFYIGVFECTQKQWELVMGNNRSSLKGDCRPVECVSYDMIRGAGTRAGAGWPKYGHTVDDTSFMGKLQIKTGLIFDLPTEAQWEYACRAGTTTALNSGKDLVSRQQDAAMDEVGRYKYNQTDGKGGYLSGHTKVGSYQPNAWGLYDMHGNVSEWALDWCGENRSFPAAESEPVGPMIGSNRAVRGGNWQNDASACRSVYRYDANNSPSYFNKFLGFRVFCHSRKDLYAIIDLSGGPNAKSYPVRYSDVVPNLNNDTCRTTELWLRKIEPGTFIMGSPNDEMGRKDDTDMAAHEVTLTQPFYIGVFECTQKQWELVMGSNPSGFKGDCRPVENITYKTIRATDTQKWPGRLTYGHAMDPTTFMGKLHEKTGLYFDLPTEAQWEYACRAGSMTALNSGMNLTEEDQDVVMDELGRYKLNQSDGKNGYTFAHTNVGSYLPNAWGLYDMHGNVREWTLDWWGASMISTSAVTDPVGPAMGMNYVNRGGCFTNWARSCRSAMRFYNPAMVGDRQIGFRICYYPEQVLYAVVDLSGGASADKYPVFFTNEPPDVDDDTCRTTELWLRKIQPGRFTMGSSSEEVGYGPEHNISPHKVTLTQTFFIGVFECTQKQWELVMGSNPSKYKGDIRPVECVSYDSIRGMGTEAGKSWPVDGHAVDPTSFMGKLHEKTGLIFDLPTEAQWEFACRAGTTTALNSGENLMSQLHDSALDEVCRYHFDRGDGKGGYSEHTKVGSYLPNALGLYDMHGNVWEWCLNWGKEGISSTDDEMDPVGSRTGVYRVRRGGGWTGYARSCRAGSRDGEVPSREDCDILGFRIIFLP